MAAIMDSDGSDEETLRNLAAGGTMDYSSWPLLLTTLVSRFEKIARNDFPIPRIPESATDILPPGPERSFLVPMPSSDAAEPPTPINEDGATTGVDDSASSSAASSQGTNKENAVPALSPPAGSQPSGPRPPPAPPAAVELELGGLPPQIVAMVSEITSVLCDTFHTYPPHTIQRLAELILEPRRHYRSLPAYLHAVDRVVHVTSGNNIYPLPPAMSDMSHLSINGTMDDHHSDEDGVDGQAGSATPFATAGSSGGGGASVGSDEALGGALLTPIPWLARRVASGGDAGSESGESSTLGSEGGPSPLGAAATTPSSPAPSASSQQRQGQGQGRQFEPQVRTESTETIDGPNGVGSIETVTVSINGISSMSAAQQQRVITQGELIRQEQRAGVVPVSQLSRSGPVVASSPSAVASSTRTADGDGEDGTAKDTNSEKSDEDMADEEETPHARGPDIIGAADMGPQTPTSSTFSISSGGNVEVRGIDVEAAVGRKHEAQVPTTGESSDDVAMTPSSRNNDENPAADPAKEGDTEGSEVKKQNETLVGEPAAQAEDARSSDGMDTGPSSATMSALPSPAPGKREAEEDLDELDSKRLKGSPGEAEAGSSEKAPAAGQSRLEAASQPETETQGKASDKAEVSPPKPTSSSAADTDTIAAPKKEEQEDAVESTDKTD